MGPNLALFRTAQNARDHIVGVALFDFLTRTTCEQVALLEQHGLTNREAKWLVYVAVSHSRLISNPSTGKLCDLDTSGAMKALEEELAGPL